MSFGIIYRGGIPSLLIVLLFVLPTYFVQAQSNFRFGAVTSSEISLTQCDFDPEASAAILLDEGFSNYDNEHRLITDMHLRVKVLKESGLDYANVRLTYYSDGDLEFITDVRAVTINFDESGNRTEHPVDGQSIYQKKISKYRSELSFTFPEVRVGSILEYCYTLKAKHYGQLRDWYFQSKLPVYRSAYEVRIVPDREISYLIQKKPDQDILLDPKRGGNGIYFEMRNIPGLGDEPFMDSREDYIQKVIFQTTKYTGTFSVMNHMSSWKELVRALNGLSDFGRQLRVKIDACENFVRRELAGKPELVKMKLAHQFVREQLSWNRVNSLICEENLKQVWEKKTGNTAAINLSLVNLLQSAGMDAHPVLVSERGNGKVNKSQPFVQQFNCVYAMVRINGKSYYLDARDPHTPSYLIPYRILNTTVFIVDNPEGELVDLQEPAFAYQDVTTLMGVISPTGELGGSVQVMSKHYSRSEKVATYREGEEEFVKEHILGGWKNIKVDSLQFSGLEADTLPLKQRFVFNTALQRTGDYAFLNLNLFTGFESNPFIATNRFSHINFGYKRSLLMYGYIRLPANLGPDALPKNIRMHSEDKSVAFNRQLEYNPQLHQLGVMIRIDLNKSYYDVEEYAGLKEFFKKMNDLLNEQVVLRAKS